MSFVQPQTNPARHSAAAPAARAQKQPAAAAAAVAKAPAESTDNPYGLKAIVEPGDLVSKGVLGLLTIMSLGTWRVLAICVPTSWSATSASPP